MSNDRKRLRRIEKSLAALAERQEAMCAEIAKLATRLDGGDPAPAAAAPGASVEETIRFLDQFRAGEALGEASLGAWIEASDVACVKGGLRTVQQREGFHARLLEQRIKELGGSCQAEVPQAVFEATMQGASSRETGDVAKIRAFVSRFPDVERAIAPITDLADRLGHDPETQSLLRTIAQDERATLEWFSEACRALSSS